MKKRGKRAAAHGFRCTAVAAIMIAATSAGLLQAMLQPPEDAESPVLRPARVRQEDRDRMLEENRRVEQIGNEMTRLREAADERGEEIPGFAELRGQAEARLFQASESFSGSPESARDVMAPGDMPVPPPGPHGIQLVCFGSDGAVTTDRAACDPDQGRHFGMQPPRPMQAGGYPSGMSSPGELGEHMDAYFGDAGPAGGAGLLPIISEALARVSDMLSYVQEDPAAVGQVQQTIRWLSGLLNQYGSGQMSAGEEASLAEEVSVHLSTLQENTHPDFGPQDMGSGPDMGMILDKMDMMMAKLPQVIAIFEEEGIPVAPEAYDAYERGMALFGELRTPCAEGDMESCFRLKEVPEILEGEMRPSMEQAMMTSGRSDVGDRIEALMREGMEDGMGPGNVRGPMMPPGMGRGYGQGPMMPPGGYPMQGSEGMMPPGFMPPSGFEQMPPYGEGQMPPYGGYELPQGYQNMMLPGGYPMQGSEGMMPPGFMPPSGFEQMPPYGGYELPQGYEDMVPSDIEYTVPQDF